MWLTSPLFGSFSNILPSTERRLAGTQLVCMKVQDHSSSEQPLEYNQDHTLFGESRPSGTEP